MKTTSTIPVRKLLSVFAVLISTVASFAQNYSGHTLYVCQSGEMRACGRNSNTACQLGIGTATGEEATPQVVAGGYTNAVAVSAGYEHSLALLDNGTVLAWGGNGAGAIGQPFPTVGFECEPIEVTLPGCAVAISAGYNFSMALLADGTVWCWGYDSNGQLGDGSGGPGYNHVPVQAGSFTNAVAISAGSAHALALLSNGTVMAWGAAAGGQIGDNANTDRFSPVQVQVLGGSTLSSVAAIDAGEAHNLALLTNGDVYVWGSNLGGQLGIGVSPTSSNYARKSTGFSSSTNVDIAAGTHHSMVLRSNGTTKVSGTNSSKELGLSSPSVTYSVISGPTLSNAIDIVSPSTARHGWAVKSNGELWVWGNNADGSVGNDDAGVDALPVHINGSESENPCTVKPSSSNHPQPCCVSVLEHERIELGADGNETFTGGFTYIGQNLSVDNIITLENGYYYFTNCDVICWKDAKIVVKSNARLYIRTNSHLYACGDMWDGIYVENQGRVYVQSGSIIEDAEVALDVMQNGTYVITNSILNKNYIHLRHTGPTNAGRNPYVITNSKFLCQNSDSDPTHTNLLPPRQNEYTWTQIAATNVDRLLVGISGSDNYFDHAVFGILAGGVRDVEVLYNHFDDVDYFGTWAAYAPNVSGAQIDINHNTYDKSIYPIFCYDNDVAVKTHITNNTISFNGMVSPPNVMTGITYQEITPASGYDPVNPSNSQYNYVDISDNFIYNAPCGIQLTNLTGDQTAPTAKLYVGENYITHTKIPNDGQAGIKTANVKKGVFKANEVKHPTNNVNWWETGIRLSDGYGNALTCNNTHDVGRGIFLDGIQTPDTRLILNEMQNNQIGLFLNWSVIGAQGASGDPRDNKWLGTSWNSSNPNTHVEGTNGTLSEFWVRSTPTPPSIYIPQYNNNGGGGTSLAISQTGGSWIGGCIYTSGASFKTDGELDLGSEDLLSELPTGEPTTERERSQFYMAQYNLYGHLKRDTELTTTDAELEAFVLEHNETNLGKLYQVVSNFRQARAGGDTLATGEDLLNAVQPENLVEQTLKDVFSILYTHAIDLTALDEDGEARLREIAQLCPLDYGFGVYTARAALLKLDTLPKHYVSECEMTPSPEQVGKKLDELHGREEFHVYPNPSSSSLTLNYRLGESESGVLQVLDMTGRQALVQPLTSEEGTILLSLHGLSSGTYLIRVEVGNELRHSERISILNE